MPDPKQPPYDLESEQSVIGGVCIRNSALDEIALLPDDFYRLDHQLIWSSILGMYADRIPIDFVTLATRMRELGKLDEVGGLTYLGTLTADCPSAANVVAYADTVRERSVLRRLIAVGQDISDLGWRPDGLKAAECLEIAEQRVFSLRTSAQVRTDATAYEDIDSRVEAVMQRNAESDGCYGHSTGLQTLDGLTFGLHETDLTILAGRPSMGKSAFAGCIADHFSIYEDKAVAIFTMEMSAEQWYMRSLSNVSGVPLNVIRGGRLNRDDASSVTEARKRLRKAKMFVDETGSLSPFELRAKARRYMQKHPLKLIVVDYIQLMQVPGTKENRTNEVSQISRSLKALAKELRVPVIALSQLNRGLENRENKRPRMADLRESGGIEQDADGIWFIHREWVFNKKLDREDTEIIVAKQRNGDLGELHVRFQGEFMRFSDREPGWIAPVAKSEEAPQPPTRRGYQAPVHVPSQYESWN